MADKMMKAARLHDYGEPETVVVEQAPVPELGEGQVLVKVKAAGVNPADWKYGGGAYKAYVPLNFPWTPGLEVAGVVEAVGPNVTKFKPGQAVFGTAFASFAEYAVVAEGTLHAKPEHLSFDQAGGVPVGALTAWGAVETADLKPGQKVLVHGGAGGVGMYVVQLAKWKGAYVITTASSKNADFVRSLGADEVIDYNAGPFENSVKGLDAVIDTVGGELAERSFHVLRPDGIYVTVAGRIDTEEAEAHGIRAAGAGRASEDKLVQISELLQAGKLKHVLGPVYPLSETGKALAQSKTGHGRGRITIHVAD